MNVVTVLKKAGLKNTKNRREILGMIEGFSGPVSAQDVKHECSHLDQVTIYRNLNEFTQRGILKEVILGTDKARYELANLEHHHHIVCDSCGKVAEIDLCLPTSLMQEIQQLAVDFTQVTDHQLEFKGVCTACS